MVLLPNTKQGVVVLINAGSQFEIAGANEVMSRIPMGVVNILRGEKPPSGFSIAQFFVVFDAIVLIVLTTQVWSFIRLLRRELPAMGGLPGGAKYTVPLVWELRLSLYILVTFPASLHATWGQSFREFPDLTLVLLVVTALWLATGVIRVGRLVPVLTRRPPAVEGVSTSPTGQGLTERTIR
jgi:hypothetical protein